MPSYPLNQNGNYCFRIPISSDLTNLIPSAESVKSLKSKYALTARLVALPYQHYFLKTFALLRAGCIIGDQAQDSIKRSIYQKTPLATTIACLSMCYGGSCHSCLRLIPSYIICEFLKVHK